MGFSFVNIWSNVEMGQKLRETAKDPLFNIMRQEGFVRNFLFNWRYCNLSPNNYIFFPALISAIVFNFLKQEKLNVLPHSPYPPDFAPWDFFLFPKLK